MIGQPGKATVHSVSSEQWENESPEWRARQAAPVTYRMAIGGDLSYTEGSGDFASFIPVADWGGRYYVRHVYRFRRDILNARKMAVRIQREWPGVPMCAYISGPEKGVLQLLAQEVIDSDGKAWPPVMIAGMIAKGDIVIRAQRSAELWSQGGIVVPEGRPWTQDFVSELRAFSGSGSVKDQVSALISAVDYLEAGRAMATTEVGSYKRTRV